MSEVKDSAIKLFGKTISLSVKCNYDHHFSSAADDFEDSCDRNLETSLHEDTSNMELQPDDEIKASDELNKDSPLCESVASVLSLSDKRQNCVQNGFNNRPEQRIHVSHGGRDNGEDRSSGSSTTASHSSEKGGNCGSQEARTKNYQCFTPQLPYFPGPPWPYPWNSPMPPPTLYPSSFPVSFYPETSYWSRIVPGNWNFPCVSPSSSSLSQYAPHSTPASLTLGKHSRDGNIINPGNSSEKEPSKGTNNPERSVLVPKTLRIDDRSKAAKSSIWAALGIKSDKTNSGEGLFKGFQSKGDDRNFISPGTSAVLQANPAALSRSFNFHEST
ncbi:hypothetical protein Pint_22790 [Pistacia integerrima]|uniref:Uncharacterized protein n=1 Tax=Pistacia integerrima TaxID=434235 RepID=A0ACC0YKJ3_9ROSI|nr:hypothetical protein Pint_22790 [Pistacia integerrima]